MKTKINVECWNCETNYDYAEHEVCPICDRHWLDARFKDTPPEPGTRVSVRIDHISNRLRTIPALLLVILLFVSSCARYTCPTYSDTKPITKFPDELVATDTTTVDKFSLAEKTGAVLFVLFAVYATNNAKE